MNRRGKGVRIQSSSAPPPPEMVGERQSQSPPTQVGGNKGISGPSTQRKRGRGPTKVLKLLNMAPGEEKKLKFNEFGQPIGENVTLLAGLCGVVDRNPNFSPLQVDKWFQIPDHSKERMRRHIQTQSRTDGGTPTQVDLFFLTHTQKNGRAVDERSEEIMSKFRELSNSNQDGSSSISDIYTHVMGPERHGRVRGYGLGQTPTSVFGSLSSQYKTSYEEMQSQVQDMHRQMEEMQQNMQEKIQQAQQETKQEMMAMMQQMMSQRRQHRSDEEVDGD
ncbi:hypothetical protein HHK36_006457 [Tetracentron sinense]|uniref:Uncharacterized protein n=1 Tax=Tetracentron sinense TaxID=13715 RepID=A0A834ZH86_TETSI|nr:hypothetical protein HHK36_006457 [Tetracentron sinense]